MGFFPALLSIVLNCCYFLCRIFLAFAVSCIKCDSIDDGENCFTVAKDSKGEACENEQDLCFKITTIAERPNNGPEDMFSDNEG